MIFLKVILTDDSPCPIKGKNFGLPMVQVPSEFLDWFMGQTHLKSKYPEVVEYFEKNKGSIDQDIDDDRR